MGFDERSENTPVQLAHQLERMAHEVRGLATAGFRVLDRWSECGDEVTDRLDGIYPDGFNESFDEWVAGVSEWARDIEDLAAKVKRGE
jgi:hypothetical protein